MGAMRTTPTVSLGMLLGVPPLHLDIKGRAANSAYRLRSYGQWKPGTRHSKIPLLEEPVLEMRTDFILRRFQFGRHWTVTIPSLDRRVGPERGTTVAGTGRERFCPWGGMRPLFRNFIS